MSKNDSDTKRINEIFNDPLAVIDLLHRSYEYSDLMKWFLAAPTGFVVRFANVHVLSFGRLIRGAVEGSFVAAIDVPDFSPVYYMAELEQNKGITYVLIEYEVAKKALEGLASFFNSRQKYLVKNLPDYDNFFNSEGRFCPEKITNLAKEVVYLRRLAGQAADSLHLDQKHGGKWRHYDLQRFVNENSPLSTIVSPLEFQRLKDHLEQTKKVLWELVSAVLSGSEADLTEAYKILCTDLDLNISSPQEG